LNSSDSSAAESGGGKFCVSDNPSIRETNLRKRFEKFSIIINLPNELYAEEACRFNLYTFISSASDFFAARICGVRTVYPSFGSKNVRFSPNASLNFLFIIEICVLMQEESGSLEGLKAYFKMSVDFAGLGYDLMR
jgi:hypothetical protein